MFFFIYVLGFFFLPLINIIILYHSSTLDKWKVIENQNGQNLIGQQNGKIDEKWWKAMIINLIEK